MVYPNLPQNFTVGFLELLSTHLIPHCCIMGNFPFKKTPNSSIASNE